MRSYYPHSQIVDSCIITSIRDEYDMRESKLKAHKAGYMKSNIRLILHLKEGIKEIYNRQFLIYLTKAALN